MSAVLIASPLSLPMSKDRAVLYFDHNATSPLSPAARDAWLEATERLPGNPSSQHRLGQRADRAMETARERLAQILGCAAGDLTWASGATEAVNMAVAGFASREGEAWISAIEHPCVLESVRHWFAGRYRLIPVAANGVIELSWLEAALRAGPAPAFVGLQAANNETGVLQPWQEARELCAAREIPFFCDAAQWIGKMPAAGLGGCQSIAGCAHKFGGPQGVGFLTSSGPVKPLLRGGPQEEGRRAGTENVAGILAMVAALEARVAQHGEQEARADLRDAFETELLRRLPAARILGLQAPRLWNTSAVIMPEIDCRQRWVVKLDKAGCAASTGSACASGKEQPSHVLSAMGLPGGDAGRVLRFSSGWETTREDWQQLVEKIAQAAAELAVGS